MVSGKTVDKFATSGLTPAPASKLDTVVVSECPVNIECKVTQVLSLGSHNLFLGEIVAIQVDEDILDEHGEIDPAKAKAFAYGSHRYWALGQVLGRHGYSAKV
jgi:flavin reductase (DIM6/NTAB) family NADH-FMN oxidoreductase RutF